MTFPSRSFPVTLPASTPFTVTCASKSVLASPCMPPCPLTVTVPASACSDSSAPNAVVRPEALAVREKFPARAIISAVCRGSESGRSAPAILSTPLPLDTSRVMSMSNVALPMSVTLARAASSPISASRSPTSRASFTLKSLMVPPKSTVALRSRSPSSVPSEGTK